MTSNNHSVAISVKTLHKSDANSRKSEQWRCVRKGCIPRTPKLPWRFTKPNIDQTSCEVPGYGPYQLRPLLMEHDSMKRSLRNEAEISPAQKFSAPLKSVTAMISWEAIQYGGKHRATTEVFWPTTQKRRLLASTLEQVQLTLSSLASTWL
jgi:hypothetical protein